MRRNARTLLAVVVVLIGSACTPESDDLMPLVTLDTSRMEAPIQKQLATAEQEFRSATAYASHPDLVGPQYGELGTLYLAYEIYAAAEAPLVNAARLQPDIYRWQHLLGHLYADWGRSIEAVEHFRMALDLQPDAIPTRVKLALLELDLGGMDSAWRLGEEILALDPETAAGYYITGLAAVQRGDYEVAAARLEQSLAREPDADFTWNPLAQAYRALGRADDANAAQARAGGQEIGVRDDLVGGLSDLRVGSDADIVRGRKALREGRLEQAIVYLRRGLEAAPDRLPAWRLLGLAFGERGDMTQAREAFQKILEQTPEHASTLSNIGSTYAREGDDREAIAWYRRALENDPEVEDGELNLANALQRTRSCSDALVHFERAVALVPGDPRPRLGLATCLSALGRDADTLRILEASVEQLPDDQTLRHGLAYFLLTTAETDLRDPERSVELATTVVTAAPTPDAQATLALALAMTGDFDKAVEVQEAAVKSAEQQGLDAARREALINDLTRLRDGEIPGPH